MPDALCPRCSQPVTIHADESVECTACLTFWPSLAEMNRAATIADNKAAKASEDAQRLLAKEVRTDANYRIRELIAELDPLSPDQFAVKRAELMRRYALSKSEVNNFYSKAHPRKEPKPTKPEPSEREIEALPFRILGRADDGLAYFEGYQRTLETLRMGAGITKEFLYLLADAVWWENEFRGGKAKIDMDAAKFYLISKVNAIAFDPTRLRGRGAWREE